MMVQEHMTFWMAMILNPSIQKKAQAEFDAIVGNDRLPTNKDKADLPHLEHYGGGCPMGPTRPT